MQQVHARQELLPGAAGPAVLGGLGCGHTVGAQLCRGQHPALNLRQMTEGAGGERGVVGHDPGVPAPGAAPNRCYTPVDKCGQHGAKVRAFDCRKRLVRVGAAEGYGFRSSYFVTVVPAYL
ncbi:hypothetical protein GCM10022206_82840 [Streptomyces chiangmaiensis]